MSTKKRISYIDAMRGFTMFLVVFGHVFVYSLAYETDSVVSSFFITFRMPMFFFISGYIGFKAIERWTTSFYFDNLGKKALVQLLPSFVFLFIWCTARGEDFLATFLSTGMNIYWFTEVLFEFFIVYFTIALLSNKISAKLFDPIIIIIALITTVTISFFFQPNSITSFLSLRAFLRYFQFFAIGLLCRKYNDFFLRIITTQKARTILLILFFSLFLLMWRGPWAEGSLAYKINHDFIIRYVGLGLVFSLFASNSEYFDRDGRISIVMQFVGRRTLDIFLLHYFFLPDISFLSPYFCSNQNPTIEVIVALLTASVVLCLSIALSSIIRSSNFLAHYLFGVKAHQK